MKTIGVEELSKIIHKAPSTIRTFSSSHPELLPPMLIYSGRRLLWEYDVVVEWMRGELKRR